MEKRQDLERILGGQRPKNEEIWFAICFMQDCLKYDQNKIKTIIQGAEWNANYIQFGINFIKIRKGGIDTP